MQAKIKTVDYGVLASSSPANRDAALARDGSGEHFNISVPEIQEHWKAPPPTNAVPSNAENLIGRRFGKFQVVGYLGPRWLVRCGCGDYEARRGKAIRNPKNTADCCWECQVVVNLKRGDAFRRTGRDQRSVDHL